MNSKIGKYKIKRQVLFSKLVHLIKLLRIINRHYHKIINQLKVTLFTLMIMIKTLCKIRKHITIRIYKKKM